MAQPLVKTASKDHRTRKNHYMAEQFAKRRTEQNALRGKQIWVGGSVKEGGFWARDKDYDLFISDATSGPV